MNLIINTEQPYNYPSFSENTCSLQLSSMFGNAVSNRLTCSLEQVDTANPSWKLRYMRGMNWVKNVAKAHATNLRCIFILQYVTISIIYRVYIVACP